MIMGHREEEEMDQSPQPSDRLQDNCGDPVKARVVVGIDGSDTSWDAFCWACGETGRLGGRTVAVFVDQTSGAAAASATASLAGAAVALGDIQQSFTDQAHQLADQVCAHGRDHGVDVTFVHAHGDTAKELLRIAERRPRRSACRRALHQGSTPPCRLTGSPARRKARCAGRRRRALTGWGQNEPSQGGGRST